MTTRLCPKCREELPLSAFGSRINNGKKQSLPYCRPCHLAYHREWRQRKGPGIYQGYEKVGKERYPERFDARRIAKNAIATGQLIPGPCVIGGTRCGKTEAHHDDYTKPLEVRWVCRRHHRQLDRERQAKERAA